jgi:uncharacterized RDD family membrane protein YckC
LEIRPLKEAASEPEAPFRQVPIDFQFQTRIQEPAKPRNVDWRAELRRKLSERSAAQANAKGEPQASVPGVRHPSDGSEGVAKPKGSSQAFKHPLAEAQGLINDKSRQPAGSNVLFPGASSAEVKPAVERPAVVSSVTKPQTAPESPPGKVLAAPAGARPEKKDPHLILEKPLVRTPPRSRSTAADPRPAATPEQRRLVLEFETPAEPEQQNASDLPAEEDANRISAEVLFSRVLAGIIDLLLPVLQSFLFTVTGSRVLGFELFSASALSWIAYLFVGFYLLNSLFFLLLVGMTPGMYLTEIRLRGSDSDEYSAAAVVVRVLLYLPVLITVVGLLTALVDNRRRCLHDLVSGTQIVPQSEEEVGPAVPL